MYRPTRYLLLAALAVLPAGPAQAQRGAAVPPQFHGQWAPSPRGCANRGPDTQVVRVDARGWRSFEEGARIVGRVPARPGSHAFRILSFGGADERPGTLTLRFANGRLQLAETVGGRTTRQSLVRCRGTR